MITRNLLLFIFLCLANLLYSQDLELTLHQAHPTVTWPFLWCQVIDKEGKHWVGSERGEIFFRENNEWKEHTVPSALENEDIWTISFADEEMWVGSDVGLFLFKDGEWTHYNMDNTILPVNKITEFAKDKAGTAWIGTNFDGLVLKNGEDWSLLNKDNSVITDNEIIKIIALEDKVWVLTEDELISFIDGQAEDVYTLQEFFRGFPAWGRDVHITPDGEIWIASHVGLAKLKDGEWQEYEEFYNKKIGKVFVDVNNIAWVGETFFGLHRIDGANIASFSGEDINSDIPSQPLSIIADSNNHKWVNGNIGAFLLEINDEFFESTSAVHEIAGSTISVYPNPIQQDLYIEYTGPQQLHIKLVDINGRLVAETDVQSTRHIIDMERYAEGMYFLEIISPNSREQIMEKIIKY